MSSGDPETRSRILKATWQLMEKREGRNVRIEDVARAAGVSRQAVYLHFKTRADLLVATVRYVDEVKDVNARVARLMAATDGEAALDAYVEFWGNYIPEIYGLAKALLAARETDAAAAAAWDDRMGVLRQACRSAVECLQRSRLLALEVDTNTAAELLWSLSSFQVWENLTVECGWSQTDYVSRMKVGLKRLFVKTAA